MNKTDGIKFASCKWDEIRGLVETHIRANNITVDSFWEDHVTGSNHYKMTAGDKIAGWFSIHGGQMIILFNVFDDYANQAQELFARVKNYEHVTNAMVPTGDEFFMSLCVDNFTRIEKQAYFSIYTEKDMPSERKIELNLRLADVGKDSEILKLSGDFLDEGIEHIKSGADYLEIYIAEYKTEVVGFGVIEYGRVVSDIASVGMFVRDKYRQKGIGANILRLEKEMVRAKGYRAFSGCWYYNHNSLKSMQSAGAYSKTRLLRFYF